MTPHHWYVRYPSGKESQLVSLEEAVLLQQMYGGGIHQEWSYGTPKASLRLPRIASMFAL